MLTPDEKELLEAAVDKWGKASQEDMVTEECAELIVALNHARRGRAGINAVVEEGVDVELALEQLKIMTDCPNLWAQIRSYKLKRLKEKLERQS